MRRSTTVTTIASPRDCGRPRRSSPARGPPASSRRGRAARDRSPARCGTRTGPSASRRGSSRDSRRPRAGSRVGRAARTRSRAVQADRHVAARLDPETREVVGVHAQPVFEAQLAEPLDDGGEVDAAVTERRRLGDEDERPAASRPAVGRARRAARPPDPRGRPTASGASCAAAIGRRSAGNPGTSARMAARTAAASAYRRSGPAEARRRARRRSASRAARSRHRAGRQVSTAAQLLHPPFEVGQRAVGLGERRRRQEGVDLEGRQVEILGDHEVAVGPRRRRAPRRRGRAPSGRAPPAAGERRGRRPSPGAGRAARPASAPSSSAPRMLAP